MKPDKDSWPMRLSVMVEKAINKLNQAKDESDVEEKKRILEELKDQGFPGMGVNSKTKGGVILLDCHCIHRAY